MLHFSFLWYFIFFRNFLSWFCGVIYRLATPSRQLVAHVQASYIAATKLETKLVLGVLRTANCQFSSAM